LFISHISREKSLLCSRHSIIPTFVASFLISFFLDRISRVSLYYYYLQFAQCNYVDIIICVLLCSLMVIWRSGRTMVLNKSISRFIEETLWKNNATIGLKTINIVQSFYFLLLLLLSFNSLFAVYHFKVSIIRRYTYRLQITGKCDIF